MSKDNPPPIGSKEDLQNLIDFWNAFDKLSDDEINAILKFGQWISPILQESKYSKFLYICQNLRSSGAREYLLTDYKILRDEFKFRLLAAANKK